jgi:hypothetical protein
LCGVLAIVRHGKNRATCGNGLWCLAARFGLCGTALQFAADHLGDYRMGERMRDPLAKNID